jgi:hypothetical protein
MRFWTVDLTSDFYVSNATISRIEADTEQKAGEIALSRMKDSDLWRVTNIY